MRIHLINSSQPAAYLHLLTEPIQKKMLDIADRNKEVAQKLAEGIHVTFENFGNNSNPLLLEDIHLATDLLYEKAAIFISLCSICKYARNSRHHV
jgi:hypothetical protein